MKSLMGHSALVALALLLLATPVRPAQPAGTVAGVGKGVTTYSPPDDDSVTRESSLEFAIAATVNANGSARGYAAFAFPKPLAKDWGAVPGVDLILLAAEINAGSVDDDGTVRLYGEFVEVDLSFTEGVLFVEKDTELTKIFELVIAADGESFTLKWCLLPTFPIEVTRGKLRVR